MFQNFKKKFFPLKKQHGQELIFFAIIIPVIFIFIGAAADFGWLYLNQSRLQNAADAAATAGANMLIQDEKELSDYTYTTFVSNYDEGLQELMKTQTVSNRSTASGDVVAKEYAKKNLNAWLGNNVTLVDTASDEWDKVRFQKILYGKNTEDYSALYYTVILSEKLNHLFSVMDYFDFMELESQAMAAVKITHVFERPNTAAENSGSRMDLFTQMKTVEIRETYPNWDEIQLAKGSDKLADKRSVLTCGHYYNSANTFQTELSLLNGWAFEVGSSRVGNPRRYGKDDKQTKKDDLFIDFQAELQSATKNTDLDLKNFDTAGTYSYGWIYGDNSQNFNRIHVPIEIADVYPISEHNTNNIQREAPDPLYAFIEQDTIATQVTRSDGKQFSRNQMNTVRQLIINVAVTNTQKDSSGEYLNRPIVFFYEGPEKADETDTDAGGKHIRDSKPVILNLFADFRGIVFAPNSPVCINGNGFKWEGFAVGSDFCRLKTGDEYVAVTYNSKTYYVNENNLKSGSKHDGNIYVTWKKANYYVNEVHLRRKTDSDYDKYQYPYTATRNGETYYLDSIYNLFTEQNKDNDIEVKYNGRKYYIPQTALLTKVTEEAVTFKENATIDLSNEVATFNSKKAITYSDKTVTCQVNEMYVDQRGEVQFAELKDTGTVTVKVPRKDDENQAVIEKPLYFDNDEEDPYYYNYKIFNLHKDSRYASFFLVKLPNYNYLTLNDLKGNNSQDMFFTTPRSKLVD